MKSVLFAKTAKTATRSKKPAESPPPTLTFVQVGPGDGHPVPDLQARLEAFYAKYPESRRTLRKGQRGTVEQVKEARDRR